MQEQDNTAPRQLHVGYWSDNTFTPVKPFTDFAQAESAMHEIWEATQDEIDEGKAVPAFTHYGVCSEMANGEGYTPLLRSLPLSAPSHIVLRDTESTTPFSVSLAVLCVSLFGGKTKNWKLVRRDVYSGEEGISYIVAYANRTKLNSPSTGFLSLKNIDGKLIVDAQYLESASVLPSPIPNAEFEYDCAEVRSLFEGVTKPFHAGKKLRSIRKTYSELGENEAGLVSLICPEGPPNNTNIYTLTLKTLQPMFVDGVAKESVTIEVMGDWEMADLLSSLQKLNQRITIQVLSAPE